MKKLAAVMIVKNEEALLSRCLDSVKGVDDIIICDTGSTDKTVEIAKRYTDHVYTDYTWEDSFCKARNHALSKVPGDIDWILSIDADEYLVSSVEEVRAEIEKADTDTLGMNVIEEKTKTTHSFPRLYRNRKEIFWVNDVHNLLNKDDHVKTNLGLVYGYSPAHKKDPDRAMRILMKTIAENPEAIRERYYLGKEYNRRKLWQKAIDIFDEYIERSRFISERCDAYLQRANSYAGLKNYDEACNSALMALKHNANFKEALFFLAEHMDWKNADRWLSFAELADNSNLLFNRTATEEKNGEYYSQLFEKDSDMSRYRDILELIGKIVGEEEVLDIGCGLAELAKYVTNYSGFDFSRGAIKSGVGKGLDVWLGDAYDKKNYKDSDIYVATEVLEHLDDIKVIRNLPSGARFIFTVPSFRDPSHLRIYTEDLVRMRLPVDISKIHRFNWRGSAWRFEGTPTVKYILLVDSVIR